LRELPRRRALSRKGFIVKKLDVVTATTMCALLVAACATEKPTEPPPQPTLAVAEASSAKGAAREHEVVVAATVEKVDVKERQVTLRGPDGSLETIRVGPEVRNLPQVKRGDHVVATYYQSVAFEIVKPGQAQLGATMNEGVGRAKLGDKPGAIDARVLTIVADIVSLDRKNQQAVLKGPEGKTMTVDVQDPRNFDKVKVGDRVEITLTEAVAIDVRPAPQAR
jgi:Cu/Ag efflux protein CusF